MENWKIVGRYIRKNERGSPIGVISYQINSFNQFKMMVGRFTKVNISFWKNFASHHASLDNMKSDALSPIFKIPVKPNQRAHIYWSENKFFPYFIKRKVPQL